MGESKAGIAGGACCTWAEDAMNLPPVEKSLLSPSMIFISKQPSGRKLTNEHFLSLCLHD